MKRAPRLRGLAAVSTGDTALTPQAISGSRHWAALQHAGVPLTVRIPMPSIRLRDVQALTAGTTFESMWPATEEVPLLAAGVALSWCEFEGAEHTMAVRMTRLA